VDKRELSRFLHPDVDRRHDGITGGGDFGRLAAGHLRAAAARYAGDRATQDLVGELLRRSPEFAALWPRAGVCDQRHLIKTIDHPQLGPIALTCDIRTVPASPPDRADPVSLPCR
jgi:phage terminase large subunit-like protein